MVVHEESKTANSENEQRNLINCNVNNSLSNQNILGSNKNALGNQNILGSNNISLSNNNSVSNPNSNDYPIQNQNSERLQKMEQRQ